MIADPWPFLKTQLCGNSNDGLTWSGSSRVFAQPCNNWNWQRWAARQFQLLQITVSLAKLFASGICHGIGRYFQQFRHNAGETDGEVLTTARQFNQPFYLVSFFQCPDASCILPMGMLLPSPRAQWRVRAFWHLTDIFAMLHSQPQFFPDWGFRKNVSFSFCLLKLQQSGWWSLEEGRVKASFMS